MVEKVEYQLSTNFTNITPMVNCRLSLFVIKTVMKLNPKKPFGLVIVRLRKYVQQQNHQVSLVLKIQVIQQQQTSTTSLLTTSIRQEK